MSTRPQERKWGQRPDPDDVRRLHAAGESRNGTARALGVSTRMVDAVAAEIGVSWSADATRDAVETRRHTAEVERLELAAKFRAVAARALDRAIVEDDTAEARRLTATAAEAARTDLHISERNVPGEDGTTGGEPFAELLDAIRGRPKTVMDDDGETIAAFRDFEDLDEVPVEVLDPDGEFECSPHPEDSPGWE